jgi:hypothetical protein
MTYPQNWIVRVYNNRCWPIATWIINGRTEREADREAMAEVERNWPGRDWSITALPAKDRAA